MWRHRTCFITLHTLTVYQTSKSQFGFKSYSNISNVVNAVVMIITEYLSGFIFQTGIYPSLLSCCFLSQEWEQMQGTQGRPWSKQASLFIQPMFFFFFTPGGSLGMSCQVQMNQINEKNNGRLQKISPLLYAEIRLHSRGHWKYKKQNELRFGGIIVIT